MNDQHRSLKRVEELINLPTTPNDTHERAEIIRRAQAEMSASCRANGWSAGWVQSRTANAILTRAIDAAAIALTKKCEGLEKSRLSFAEQLDSAQTALASAQAETRALEERVAECLRDFNRLDASLFDVVTERNKLTEQLAAVQKERDAMEAKLSTCDQSRDDAYNACVKRAGEYLLELAAVQQALRESEAGAAVMRSALEDAKHALDVCYSDSHAIRPDWLRDQGGPVVAQAVENIRKWSGSRRGTIMSALATAAGASLLADVERLTADRDRLVGALEAIVAYQTPLPAGLLEQAHAAIDSVRKATASEEVSGEA